MKVVITAKIPEVGMNILRKNFDLIEAYGGREDLKSKIVDADGLLVLLSDNIDKEILEAGKKLKCVSVYAVGYNNVDLSYAQKRGIKVTNTPDILTEATADLTILLILGITRRLKEGMEMMENGSFTGWKPELLLGREISEMKVGIIGAGRIGSAVIRKLLPFKCEILYNNRSKKCHAGGQYADFNTIIEESDLITIHTPLTPETTHLFNYNIFKKMKSNSYIVNTSRGKVIDEKSLVKSLIDGEIAGAALDVFEFEPEVEEELKMMKNVILTPHIGTATRETRDKMSVMAADNIYRILNNKECKNIVIF